MLTPLSCHYESSYKTRFSGMKRAPEMRLKPMFTDHSAHSDLLDAATKTWSHHDHTVSNIDRLANALANPVLQNYTEAYRRVAVKNGILTIDLATGTRFAPDAALTGDITVVFKNPPKSGVVRTITLMVQHDATTRNIIWSAPVDFGANPYAASGPNKTDVIVLTTKDGGATYHAGVLGRGHTGSLGAGDDTDDTYVIDIVANTNNINLKDYITSHSTWDGITPSLFLVTVAPGVIIGSTSTSLDALVIPAMPVGSSVVFTNNGYIVGKGGNGGEAGMSVTNTGENGGNAIRVQFQTTITNNGVIGGGGGGGGTGGLGYDGGGGGSIGVKYAGGAPGGGGAGSAVGAAGMIQPSSGAYVAPPPGGTPGTLTLGGAGGASGAIVENWGGKYLRGGSGGAGGGLGAAGSPGASGYTIGSAGGALPGSSGGAAGKAVIGNELITWVSTGSIYGAVV